MGSNYEQLQLPAVALRTEGVDRNLYDGFVERYSHVALRTEGVDRNLKMGVECTPGEGRPPHGGRG